MNTPSEKLINIVDKYLELSDKVQHALAELEGFYNDPNTQLVLDNVEQAEVSIEAFNRFEDSCICGDYHTYIEDMIVS
jgi:hypothetical protein